MMKIDLQKEIKLVEKMQGVLELLQDAKRRNVVVYENIQRYKNMGFFPELARRSEHDLEINEMAIKRIENYYIKLKSN